jgi:hypothetical protein
MDNMGGLRKLYYIDASYYITHQLAESNLYSLSLDEKVTVNEIAFTQETGKISEVEEITDNALAYNYEVTCTVPKCAPETVDLFLGLRLKQLLMIAEDNNGNFWLTGAPGSYFNISITNDTGANTQDRNSKQLKISASLPTPSVFIIDPND